MQEIGEIDTDKLHALKAAIKQLMARIAGGQRIEHNQG